MIRPFFKIIYYKFLLLPLELLEKRLHNTKIRALIKRDKKLHLKKKGIAMKKTKLFGALTVLLAMTMVACGPKEQPSKEPKSEAPASEPSEAPKSEASSEAPKSEASSEAPTTSEAPAEDWLTVIPHTWVDGTPAQNSAGKEYIPLTDGDKVGVKISIQNWEVAEGAASNSSLDTDGGLLPKNDHTAFIAFKVKAPKAGDYQLVMTGKCSSGSGESKTLDERSFAVTLNGESVDVKADRNPVTTTSAPFVAAPTVALRGPEQEDVIAVSCPDYRIKFDTASYLLFQEH